MEFYRYDSNTIMSGLVVRYKVLRPTWDNFEISASRDGVLIQGYSGYMTSTAEMDAVSEVLRRAQLHAAFLSRAARHEPPLSFDREPTCVVEHRKYYAFSQEYKVIAARTVNGLVE